MLSVSASSRVRVLPVAFSCGQRGFGSMLQVWVIMNNFEGDRIVFKSDVVHFGTVLCRSSQKCFIILFNFVTVAAYTYKISTTRNIFICVVHFFVATNYTKLKIIFIFQLVLEKIEPSTKNYSTFTQKIVTNTKLSKVCVGDPIPDL
jgi:hypothetical protein